MMNGRTNVTTAGGDDLQIPLDPCASFVAIAGNAQVTLTWTDPKDKYATPEGEQAGDPDQLVSVWKYTAIVRKEGSAPTGIHDGILVAESQVHNQYQTNGYIDSGLTNDRLYYYGVFAVNEDGIESEGAIDSAIPKGVQIYGVEWNGTDTTKWTRIGVSKDFTDPNPAVNNGDGNSPFDELYPWKDMNIIEDPEAGVMVSIPKFYYRWTKLNPGLRLEIADDFIEGFHISPAHIDRSDGNGERDIIYVGRYHSNKNDYKSTNGVPGESITSMNANSFCRQLGDTIYCMDFATHTTIQMLYLVEYANWDSQSVIGIGGNIDNDYDPRAQSGTDAMIYHTGTAATSRSINGACQYRHISGLWDNVGDHITGISANRNLLRVEVKSEHGMLPTDDSPIIFDAGTLDNYKRDGFPSVFDVCDIPGYEWVIYPIEFDGSATTYTTDRCAVGSSAPYNIGRFWVGSPAGTSPANSQGLFYRGFQNEVGSQNDVWMRPIKLP